MCVPKLWIELSNTWEMNMLEFARQCIHDHTCIGSLNHDKFEFSVVASMALGKGKNNRKAGKACQNMSESLKCVCELGLVSWLLMQRQLWPGRPEMPGSASLQRCMQCIFNSLNCPTNLLHIPFLGCCCESWSQTQSPFCSWPTRGHFRYDYVHHDLSCMNMQTRTPFVECRNRSAQLVLEHLHLPRCIDLAWALLFLLCVKNFITLTQLHPGSYRAILWWWLSGWCIQWKCLHSSLFWITCKDKAVQTDFCTITAPLPSAPSKEAPTVQDLHQN